MHIVCDAENRLIEVVQAEDDPNNLTAADNKLVFKYDYLNRRVEKLVYAWDPNQGDNGDWATTASLDRRFMYHDRLLLLELDGLDSNARIRKYAWGAGTDGKLGGPNSLLAIRDVDADTNYICFNNGSGSVAQLLDRSDGSFDAAYVYDTRGDTVRNTGTYAADNPLRYKTWHCDDEFDYDGTDCDGGYFGTEYGFFVPRISKYTTAFINNIILHSEKNPSSSEIDAPPAHDSPITEHYAAAVINITRCDNIDIGLPTLTVCIDDVSHEYCSENRNDTAQTKAPRAAGDMMCIILACSTYCRRNVSFNRTTIDYDGNTGRCCVTMHEVNPQGDCKCNALSAPPKGAIPLQ